MLCGILKPSDGKGKVLGFDIYNETEKIKQNIGYMSQQFSLYNDLTVHENIDFYAATYGVNRNKRKKRIEELIELVELQGLENEKTFDLSGAWRQKLALACSIVHNPPMLFLDEATAGVDPLSRRKFWDLIYYLAGEGTSVLATTHFMDEADYCNNIAMMHQGQLIGLASPDEFKESLPGVLLQIECSKPASAEKSLRKFDPSLDISLNGARINVRSHKKNGFVKEIRKHLQKEDFHINSLERINPSIEDVFLYMIQNQETQQEPLYE
jgi:ABC-2 type transport system ATP-binding protein